MERTDYVAKAKSLMKQAARHTALVVVPLAVAAAASASSVVPELPTSNFSCTFDSGSSACTAGVSQINSPGLVGLKFFTAGDLTLIQSGSGTSGSFSREITMRTSSNTFGSTLPSTLPVYYDFTLTDHAGAQVTSWTLYLSMWGRYSGFFSTGGTAAGTFSGPGSIDLTFSDVQDQVMYARLYVSGTRPDTGGFVTLNVPQNSSFDFGAPAAVPEPATAGIVVAGLTIAGLVRRRRRN